MKKLITTMVMLAILIFAMSTSVQAYSMSFEGTKTEVESGETFNVTISVDELTKLANGQLCYDSTLFTYVRATQNDMEAQAYPKDGKVKWMYTELTDVKGTKTFTFTFKASDVTENKKGTFTLKDFTVSTLEDKEYNDATSSINGRKSLDVTIKNKKTTQLSTNNWTIDSLKDFELSIGETKKIKTDGDVTWSTSNSKVATVDKNGNIKGVGVGTATITATDKLGKKRTIKVTVVSKTAGVKDKITSTDKTTTTDKKLPQTGEDFTRFACLALAGIVLATGLVFKKKAKNLNKLFVILPIVAALSIPGTVNAIKLVDNTKMKAGIFEEGEMFDNMAVVAISPCKDFKTENSLNLATLNEIFNKFNKYEESGDIVSVLEDSKGNNMELTATAIPTGAVVLARPSQTAEGDQPDANQACDYTVLLYGDANGDGKICNSLDVNVIRQEYVFNKKAEGVYKKAADLYADDILDVRDVQRMAKKYLGKSEESLVKPFPEENEEGTIEIADYTKNSITVKVTLEGKEIESIEHFYKFPDGYIKNPTGNPLRSAGKTKEAEFKYTNELLEDDKPYQFSAEITTKDGKKYTTNSVSWLMGDIGPTPEFNVSVVPDKNNAKVSIDVTNKSELEEAGMLLSYTYDLTKVGPDGGKKVANVTKQTSEYTFNDLEDGDYGLIVTVTTNKGASNRESATFKINTLEKGETNDTSLAAVKLDSTDKMYTSMQYAINAANTSNETVILMKDLTESLTIPAGKNITLDLNGKTITGAEDKIYTINVLGNLKVLNGKIVRPTTTVEEPAGTTRIWATNILVEDIGNVEVLEGTELNIQVNGGTNIANLGSKNITIDGATLTASAEGTSAIRDMGTNGNIYIFSGQISGRLTKTNAGSIYIGKDSRVNYGFGTQENILSADELLISSRTDTIDAGDDTKVYFYNGVLRATYSSGTSSGSSGGATFGKVATKEFTEKRSTDELAGGYDRMHAYYTNENIVAQIESTGNEIETIKAAGIEAVSDIVNN